MRDEILVLRGRSAPDRELSRVHAETYDPFQDLPTQRRFQVSPDARVLAYARPDAREVRLLRRDGAELAIPGAGDQDLRFSPDGRALAVIAGVASGGRLRGVLRVDLRRLAVETWAELPDPSWVEHCREGLVVLHARGDQGGHALTLVPREGAPRRLAEAGWIHRFACAKAGTRVVYIAGEEVFAVDAARPEAPRLLGKVGHGVNNAEMSPDGSTVACVSSQGLHLVRGDGAPELVVGVPDIHSVWFSRDGAALAWADREQAVWRRSGGEEERRLSAPAGDLEAMRFLQGAEGLVVSRGREVLLWTPDHRQAREEVITAVDAADQHLLGADVFAGGLVLWLGTAWERVPRGKARD